MATIENTNDTTYKSIYGSQTMSATIAESFYMISSYVPLYEKDIEKGVEEMGDFASAREIFGEVRFIIYNTHRIETICEYFISSQMTLEEAICKYDTLYITEEEYVCYTKK